MKVSIALDLEQLTIKAGGSEFMDPCDASLICQRVLNLELGQAEVRSTAKTYIIALNGEHSEMLSPVPMEVQNDAEKLIDMLAGTATDWQRREEERLTENNDIDNSAALRFLVAQNAPLGLMPGCMLQNFANAANCHELPNAHGHAAHLWHVANFSLPDNHSALYRQLLEHNGLYLPKIDSPMFSERAKLLPESWRLPSYWLSLSLYPIGFAPEILGCALFEMCVPICPMLDVALWKNNRLDLHPYARARHDSSKKQAQLKIRQAITSLLAATPVDKFEVTVHRVQLGFKMSMHLLEIWQNEVESHLRNWVLDSTAAMINMISAKAQFAVGYHGRIKLAKEPLDDYLTRDPEGFVWDLARSRWIVPGKPEESLLLTRLIDFGGPMFRVFSDEEIKIIREWVISVGIESEENRGTPSSIASSRKGCPFMHSLREPIHPAVAPACKLHPRELYHQLLNQENYPSVYAHAKGFATTWLARAAAQSSSESNTIPFTVYTHKQLRNWFNDRVRYQLESYVGSGREINKSREEVVDEAVQLCPMILVDGGWIQRWTNVGHVETEVGTLLFKIFTDEIGNGDTQLNHPNIYRDLMKQMGIDLPDFRTREFAMNDLFDDESFEVPAFWLSISQFPRSFLPESLGLNLAMELSGVGGAYRTARDELRHYKFSTLFVDLHNTIDNASSGHSAMALEAIEKYMEEILPTASPSTVETHWQRVWTGFCSLAIPRRSWKELFSKPTYSI